MSAPPKERRRPLQRVGAGDRTLVRGLDREAHYGTAAVLSTAAEGDAEPRFETGWFRHYDEDRLVGFDAFLRPYHEGWYDLYPCSSWWEAMAKAIEIAAATPDCVYVGAHGGEA